MTQQEELEAIAAMLTIIAFKTKQMTGLSREEQMSCVNALAEQITDVAAHVTRIADSHYVKAGVITKLTSV